MIKLPAATNYTKSFYVVFSSKSSVYKDSSLTFFAYQHGDQLYHAGRPIANIFTDVLTFPDELYRTMPFTAFVVTDVIVIVTSLPMVLVPVLTGVAVTIGMYLKSEAKFIDHGFVVFAKTVSSVTTST